MTLLVRDEEDILQVHIDYHLSQGVDFFIVTDNCSTDSTSEILHEYQKQGILHYIYEGNNDYNQREWVTKMARMAYTDYGADWVINSDADEFWWPISGSLKEAFSSISNEFNVVEVQRHNFVSKEYLTTFYRDMVYRENKSKNHLGKPLPPKVAHRGDSTINISQGNHHVEGFENQNTMSAMIEILHFPMRSYEQFTNKIKNGGEAYENNQKLPKEVGATWRILFKQYKRDKLKYFYFSQTYDQIRIDKEIKSGKISYDVRLCNYLNKLYKLQL